MIILQNCSGVKRLVEEGIVYYPNDPCEREPIGSDAIHLFEEVDKAFQEQGIQWGDAIAWITHSIGISQCTPCKARQEILNKAGTLGVKETVKQILGTFKQKGRNGTS